jgi:hypothetical protein
VCVNLFGKSVKECNNNCSRTQFEATAAPWRGTETHLGSMPRHPLRQYRHDSIRRTNLLPLRHDLCVRNTNIKKKHVSPWPRIRTMQPNRINQGQTRCSLCWQKDKRHNMTLQDCSECGTVFHNGTPQMLLCRNICRKA